MDEKKYDEDGNEILSEETVGDDNSPYIKITRIVKYEIRKYNPNYGDERICTCGHTYDRHFDSWDNMSPCGCKYCECREFVEDSNHIREQ